LICIADTSTWGVSVLRRKVRFLGGGVVGVSWRVLNTCITDTSTWAVNVLRRKDSFLVGVVVGVSWRVGRCMMRYFVFSLILLQVVVDVGAGRT
jgi:hypothetical protein